MSLSINDKKAAYAAVLIGDSFIRGNVQMFALDGEYCVLKMQGPADKCPKMFTKSWGKAIETFEKYLEVAI